MRTTIAFVAAIYLCPQGPVITAQLVSNGAPLVGAPSFRLSGSPLARIGGVNDDERYELLRVTAVAISDDGNILVAAPTRGVASAGSVEVRTFDARGRFVRRIGRGGVGPGEFTRIEAIVSLSPDSLLVYDRARSRITLLDSTGRVLLVASQAPQAICCMRSGYLNVSPQRLLRPEDASPSALVRDSVHFTIAPFAQTGGARAASLTLPGRDRLVAVGSSRTTNGEFVSEFLPRPFASDYYLRASLDAIVYASSDSYRYQVFSPAGVLLRTVTASHVARPVSRSMTDSARRALCAHMTGATRARCEDAAAHMEIRTHVPAIRALFAERSGAVWLQGFELSEGGSPWLVGFDTKGVIRGVLHVPIGHRVRAVEGDVIVLERLDRDGQLAELLVHRIERNG